MKAIIIVLAAALVLVNLPSAHAQAISCYDSSLWIPDNTGFMVAESDGNGEIWYETNGLPGLQREPCADDNGRTWDADTYVGQTPVAARPIVEPILELAASPPEPVVPVLKALVELADSLPQIDARPIVEPILEIVNNPPTPGPIVEPILEIVNDATDDPTAPAGPIVEPILEIVNDATDDPTAPAGPIVDIIVRSIPTIPTNPCHILATLCGPSVPDIPLPPLIPQLPIEK